MIVMPMTFFLAIIISAFFFFFHEISDYNWNICSLDALKLRYVQVP
jgi:hypothetical protein